MLPDCPTLHYITRATQVSSFLPGVIQVAVFHGSKLFVGFCLFLIGSAHPIRLEKVVHFRYLSWNTGLWHDLETCLFLGCLYLVELPSPGQSSRPPLFSLPKGHQDLEFLLNHWSKVMVSVDGYCGIWVFNFLLYLFFEPPRIMFKIF